jgi:hypothetical protein
MVTAIARCLIWTEHAPDLADLAIQRMHLHRPRRPVQRAYWTLCIISVAVMKT